MNSITNKIFQLAIIPITFFVLTQTSSAQFEMSGISVTASAKSEAPAEVMRMSMTLEAKGPDLKAALESLAAKRKKATIAMEKLDAIEDSISFAEISAGGTSDSTQMAQMMRRSFGDDPRVAQMMKVKPPVTVTIDLTADWKLEGEPDEMFLVCDELKQKITKAEVGGGEDDGGLSEEQAELAEEMAEMMSDYGGSNEEPSGTPTFFYIRTVSLDQQSSLVSEAFGKAKTKAQRLADATQLQLGKIKTLTTQGDSMSDYAMQAYQYGYGSQTVAQGKTHEDGTKEIVGTAPNTIVHTVTIAMAFEIDQ